MALWTCVLRSSTATKGAPVITKCWTTSTGQHLRIVSFEPKRNIMQAWSSSCRKQSKCIHICTKVPLPSYFEAKLITQRPQTDHNSRTNLVSIWISFLIHFGTNFGWEGFGATRRNQIWSKCHQVRTTKPIYFEHFSRMCFYYLRDLNNTKSNTNTNTLDECRWTE